MHDDKESLRLAREALNEGYVLSKHGDQVLSPKGEVLCKFSGPGLVIGSEYFVYNGHRVAAASLWEEQTVEMNRRVDSLLQELQPRKLSETDLHSIASSEADVDTLATVYDLTSEQIQKIRSVMNAPFVTKPARTPFKWPKVTQYLDYSESRAHELIVLSESEVWSAICDPSGYYARKNVRGWRLAPNASRIVRHLLFNDVSEMSSRLLALAAMIGNGSIAEESRRLGCPAYVIDGLRTISRKFPERHVESLYDAVTSGAVALAPQIRAKSNNTVLLAAKYRAAPLAASSSPTALVDLSKLKQLRAKKKELMEKVSNRLADEEREILELEALLAETGG